MDYYFKDRYNISKDDANKLRIKLKDKLDEIGESDMLFFDKKVLQTLIFDRFDISDVFSNKDLRKLDLSDVDFLDINVRGKDLSYLNIDFYPTLVAGKSLYKTNLEGVDLSLKSFCGCNINGANLNYTNATIYVPSLIGKNIDVSLLNGCKIINDPSSFIDEQIDSCKVRKKK